MIMNVTVLAVVRLVTLVHRELAVAVSETTTMNVIARAGTRADTQRTATVRPALKAITLSM